MPVATAKACVLAEVGAEVVTQTTIIRGRALPGICDNLSGWQARDNDHGSEITATTLLISWVEGRCRMVYCLS